MPLPTPIASFPFGVKPDSAVHQPPWSGSVTCSLRVARFHSSQSESLLPDASELSVWS